MKYKKSLLLLAVMTLPLFALQVREVKVSSDANSSSKQKRTQPDERQIVATGYGSSELEARDNAFSAAIEKYVGIIVDSEAVLQNGTLVKDEILTASNGYVKSYTELSKEKTDGIWEVKVEALIRSQKIFGKEKGQNTALLGKQNRDNLNNTSARVSTKIKSKKDASKILAKKFKALFDTETLKSLVSMENISATLEEEKVRNDKIPLVLTHKIRINPKVYAHKIEALEQLFYNLGLRKHSRVDEPYVENGLLRIKNTKEIRKLKRTDIGIIKEDGSGYKLDVWSFPAHWRDVFPFTSGESIVFNDFFEIMLRAERKNGTLLFSKNISTAFKEMPKYREIPMLTASPNLVRGYYSSGFKRNRAKIITPLFDSEKILQFKTKELLDIKDSGDLGTSKIELKEK